MRRRRAPSPALLGEMADGLGLDRRIEPAESLLAHQEAAGREHIAELITHPHSRRDTAA